MSVTTASSSTVGGGSGFMSKTLTLTRKDLRSEARARSTLPPMVAFSLAVTLILAFGLPADPPPSVIAAFLWITVLFAGLIGFSRVFEVEKEEGAMDALLLVPLDRSGIFVAKALANLLFLATVQVVLVPLFVVLFGTNTAGWAALALVVVLVDVGFVSVGTLFASVASQTKSRELMLPILALPALVPIFIAAVELTTGLFVGQGFTEVSSRGWFGVLLASDVIFGITGALAFEFVLD